MFLSDVSIKRPVMAVMMTLALLVFGAIGYERLPVRQMPDIDFPTATVTVFYPGAAPEVVEEEVSDPLEEVINTIQGIKDLKSTSAEGGSTITITFELERDIDVAAQEVRDKIAFIRQNLPDEIEEPIVQKLDMNAFAIMWLAVSSPDRSAVEITEYADKVIKPRLENLEGVGQIILGGQQEFSVRIWLDPARLAACQVTVNDVSEALRTQNVEIPSGRVESFQREFSVKTEGMLRTVDAFNDLIVSYRSGTPIRIRDLGRAVPGARDMRSMARFTQKPDSLFRPTVGLGILKQTDANTVATATQIKEELGRILEDLPPGYDVFIAYDSSKYIEESIDEVKEALALGGLLAVVVIFFFLLSVRSTIIAGLAIPTSIVATFAVIYFLGFTINTLTLLALTISVGVVIDDAIVVLENIYRHRSEGKHSQAAAQEGTSEIAFAAMAATFSIAAVFLPVAFIRGMVGRMFYEFGMTVAVAVLISLFVALTLTPMLCSRFLKVHKKAGFFGRIMERFHGALTSVYVFLLRGAVRVRVLVLLIGAAVFAVSIFFFAILGKEMAPPVDQSTIIMDLKGPEGATIQYMDRYLSEAERVLADTPEVLNFFAALGLSMGNISQPNLGIAFIRLKDLDERRHAGMRGQHEVMAELRRRFGDIPGLTISVYDMPVIMTGEFGAPLQYVVMGPEVGEIYREVELYKARLSEVPGIVDVDSDLDVNKPKLRVDVLRDKAADLGVSVADIAQAMRVLLGGDDLSEYKEGGERYDVMVQMEDAARRVPEAIDDIYIRSASGELVPLGNLLRVTETVGPSQIFRYDRLRATLVQGNLEGLPLAAALDEAKKLAAETLPPSFTTSVTGQTEDMEESFASLAFAFVLSVLIIYMVLASQFNHFVHPFTIMLALPLSMIGALGCLYLFGMTVNLFSIIGIIVLMGLVTKNSILLVDYTNRLREGGMEMKEAVIQAGRVRLRPILMTALSMIFGVLPAAMGLGAGSESRQSMGVATAGGMLSSTVLTLFVVPAVYLIFEDIGGIVRRLRGKK
ncbi:MAG: efflux RND transporter permease subunit [Planctomycetota bacterium]|jgi:hydrophobe/amphiphile efflux-1 (HAE1) family protein